MHLYKKAIRSKLRKNLIEDMPCASNQMTKEIKLMTTSKIEKEMDRCLSLIKSNEKEIEDRKELVKYLKKFLRKLKNERWKR